MKKTADKRRGFFGWLGDTLERRSGWIIMGTLLVTALLLLPLLLMSPTESASDNPYGSEVVELQEKIDETFPSEVNRTFYVVEAKGGDMLTQECLYELYLNQQAFKQSDLSPYLYRRYDQELKTFSEGVISPADSINGVLMQQSGGEVDLSNASDEQVKQAVGFLLENPATRDLEFRLSVLAEKGEGGWTAPAVFVSALADDAMVTGEYAASLGQEYDEELAREHFARDVQHVLRGEERSFQAWGVAIDIDLEIKDEGKIAVLMIVAAIILMSVLIFIIFRSWLITLVVTAGLGMLIVWLKGFSNLVGLKGSMILDLIVPISILVLGIEYAIQSLFRYREEREEGKPPARALGDSTFAVGAALVLAMLTTMVAFASNAVSNIESVRGFAVAASFAIFAALVILGIFVPAVVMRYQLRKRRKRGSVPRKERSKGSRRGAWLGSLVAGVSGTWFVVLPLVLIVTGFALWGWFNVETRMDAKDFLSSRSDFVVSLDKLDQHKAEMGGEPAFIYIEGDLTGHGALYAIRDLMGEMEDDRHVSRGADGEPNPDAFIFDMLEAAVRIDYARERIEAASGMAITDNDGDLIPDTREQLEAVYEYATVNGLPQDEATLLYSPRHIQEAFVYGEAGADKDATLVRIGVPGTREQEVVRASVLELEEDMDAAMAGAQGIDFYGLTGDGYIRLDQFDAIAGSMTSSLIIAALAVLLLLILVFRSIRYALISIAPVLLVACWLYGFMYIAGYYLNMLTATIAAISVGVGIDFSIHFTERFREELRRGLDKKAALCETARTTGLALLGTGVTTALGFTVIAFAPMPMFSTYGVLTAVMIVLAVFMALFVLPSLLLLFAPGVAVTEQEEQLIPVAEQASGLSEE